MTLSDRESGFDVAWRTIKLSDISRSDSFDQAARKRMTVEYPNGGCHYSPLGTNVRRESMTGSSAYRLGGERHGIFCSRITQGRTHSSASVLQVCLPCYECDNFNHDGSLDDAHQVKNGNQGSRGTSLANPRLASLLCRPRCINKS